MAESYDEQLSRVTQMVIDEEAAWDLSPADKAALSTMLKTINEVLSANKDLNAALMTEASRVDKLEAELERLQDVLGEEDFDLVEAILAENKSRSA